MHLKVLLTTSILAILLAMLTSAQQDGEKRDSFTEVDQQWKDFKVKFGKMEFSIST